MVEGNASMAKLTKASFVVPAIPMLAILSSYQAQAQVTTGAVTRPAPNIEENSISKVDNISLSETFSTLDQAEQVMRTRVRNALFQECRDANLGSFQPGSEFFHMRNLEKGLTREITGETNLYPGYKLEAYGIRGKCRRYVRPSNNQQGQSDFLAGAKEASSSRGDFLARAKDQSNAGGDWLKQEVNERKTARERARLARLERERLDRLEEERRANASVEGNGYSRSSRPGRPQRTGDGNNWYVIAYFWCRKDFSDGSMSYTYSNLAHWKTRGHRGDRALAERVEDELASYIRIHGAIDPSRYRSAGYIPINSECGTVQRQGSLEPGDWANKFDEHWASLQDGIDRVRRRCERSQSSNDPRRRCSTNFSDAVSGYEGIL